MRRVNAGGRTFVWRAEIRCVKGDGDCHRCIRLRVWGAGKNSRALQADLLSKTWPSQWGARAADGAYPDAADVRAVIALGIGLGWDPDAVGGTYLLSEGAAGWELEGFLLTDRLHDPDAPDPTSRVIAAFERRTVFRPGSVWWPGSA